MEAIISHFNKKKIEFVNFISNFINILHKVSYEVQLEIDRQYNFMRKQYENKSQQSIKSVCQQMHQNCYLFYEQIIQKLSTILKIYTKQLYGKQGRTKHYHNNINGTEERKYQVTQNLQVFSNNKNTANLINNNNLQKIEQIHSQIASERSQKNQSDNQNTIKKISNIKAEHNYEVNVFKDSVKEQNNIRILDNSHLNVIDAQKNSQKPIKKQIQLQSRQSISKAKQSLYNSPIQSLKRYQKDFPQSIYESIKLQKIDHNQQPSQQYINKRYESPTRSKFYKQKIEILKKPSICQGLDNLIHKQAKQMLERSQSKSRYSGLNNNFNSMKNSRSKYDSNYKQKVDTNARDYSVKDNKYGINIQSPQKTRQKSSSSSIKISNNSLFAQKQEEKGGINKILEEKLTVRNNNSNNVNGLLNSQNSLLSNIKKSSNSINQHSGQKPTSSTSNHTKSINMNISPIQKYKL